MRTVLPGNGLTALRQEVDRMFDRVWGEDLPERVLSEWTPAIDFSEAKHDFTMKMEVPGIDPSQIQISLQGPLLTISGERKKEEQEKEERFYRAERSYGAFTRSIRLPIPAEESKVNAVFKNGLLTIVIPKAQAGKGTIVPIKAA